MEKDKLEKIEIKKLVPVAAKISAGKSNLLNVLYNIKLLECKDKITTKFINILRYNPKIKKPFFYHLKLKKEEDKYVFYKDLSDTIYEGEENIIEANKIINKKYVNEKNINYEELFYMTEINSEPFIRDKEYLAEHDLCDIPGLSEYQENPNNEQENGNKEQNENEIKNEDEEILQIKENAKKLGLNPDQNKRKIKQLNEKINYKNPKEREEKKEDFKIEDDIYYDLIKNNNNNKTYLTEIFKIIKEYIDGAIIIFSQDNFTSKDNYQIIAQLHHVIQKKITNFLIILNKMDLSQNPTNDIEECKGLLAKYFPKFKTFNINLNTFVPISVKKLKYELLMNKDFKSLIFCLFYNFMENWNNYILNNKDTGDLSFIEQLKNIIKRIKGKKIKKEIKSIDELNKSNDISKINNEIVSVIKDLIDEFGDKGINFGFSLNNFNGNNNNSNKKHFNNDDSDSDDEEDNIVDKLDPSFILKFYYKEKNSLTPYLSEESNKLLNYFSNNKSNSISNRKVKEEQTEKMLLNKSIIKTLNDFNNQISESKLDEKFVANLSQYLRETIEILKINNVILIPFIGEIGTGKSTIINGIIGEDVLPTGVNGCSKRGILIRYLNKNENEINIRKTYFRKEKSEENTNYFFESDDYIIGNGLEQVKGILNNLNYNYNEKEEDSFYYIRTKIKLFDDLGLEDSLKRMIYLIDLPGFGTENKFENNIYLKLMSISSCFIFTVKNSVIKDNNNRKILKKIFDQAKKQKRVFSSKLLQSSLFILNMFNNQSTEEEDIKEAQKDINELINGVDNKEDENALKNINLCFFHAKLYNNYYTNYNYFCNIKDSIKFEFRTYVKKNQDIFISPENSSKKKYKSFSKFLISQLDKKKEYFLQNEQPNENIINNENNELSTEQIKKDLNEIFRNLNLNINEEETSEILNIISFGKENIFKLNYLKYSKFEELKDKTKTQIKTLNSNMQDELEEQLNFLMNKLDLFFQKDFSKEKDLKSNELFSKEVNMLNEKIQKVYTDGQIKYYKIIFEYENKVKNSLKQKKENIKKYLEKKNYKEIVNEIDNEIKNSLEGFNKQIQEFLDNINSEINELNEKIIITINKYSGIVHFINRQSFVDYFSLKMAGKDADLAKEIFKEIKMSTFNLDKIYEEKGFIEWIKSAFSKVNYFETSLDIIINTFVNKNNYILELLIGELTKYIEKTSKDIFDVYSVTTKIYEEENEEQINAFNRLKNDYVELKYKINKAKEKLINKKQ